MKIRNSEIKDARAIAEVNIKSWQETFSGIFPNEELYKLSLDVWTENTEKSIKNADLKNKGFLLESEDKTVVGFFCPRFHSENPEIGELHAIYLLKDFHGKGYGKMMFEFAKKFLQNLGCKKMIVWTLKDKNPTRVFYDKMNGNVIAEKDYLRFGNTYKLVCYEYDLPHK